MRNLNEEAITTENESNQEKHKSKAEKWVLKYDSL